MTKLTLIKNYEAAVNALAVYFLNKQFNTPDEPPITEIKGDYIWAGGEVGDTLCAGDMYFYNFGDIVTDIREDAPVGEINKYNTYGLRCTNLGLESSLINYHSWLHGAPRTPDSTLDYLEKLKRELDEEIEKAKNTKTDLSYDED